MKQYTYGKQSIDSSDIESVVETLKSDWLTQGPKVKEFEQLLCQVTGAKYAVAVSNGTAALHLAVLALGIKRGDEGITSPITFVASANCLRYVGADVKLVDIEPDTGLIDPLKISSVITSKSKVIIPVHYAGQSCDMEKIADIAKKNKLFVIEDAAHAIGSEYKGHRVGSCVYSDMTTFSFHPVKTITTGEGGAITTNNPALYEKLLVLRTHGIVQRSDVDPWYYEMQELGFNYRMPDILASLGITQLKKLNSYVEKRRQIVNKYREELSEDPRFTMLAERDYNNSAFHLFPILLNLESMTMTKKEIFAALLKQGIRLQVHYIPIYHHPYYKNLGFKASDYPSTEKFYNQIVSLPIYPSLSEEDILIISSIIKKHIQ